MAQPANIRFLIAVVILAIASNIRAQSNRPPKPETNPAKLSGHVSLPDGKRAAGIKLEARGVRIASIHPRGYVVSATFNASAVTQADGSFEMQLEGDTAYLVAVANDRWAAPLRADVIIRAGQPVDGVNFSLSPGTLIKGTITEGEDRRPVAKRVIRLGQRAGALPKELDRLPHPGYGAPSLGYSLGTATDEQGRYQFCVGPGSWKLDAGDSAIGIASLSATIDLPLDADRPREVVKDFQLPEVKTSRLTGAVVDAEGRPIEGVIVQVVYLSRTPRGSMHNMVLTGPGGKFEMQREVVPSVLSVSTKAGEKSFVFIDEKQTEAILRIGPFAQVIGRIIDEHGQAANIGLVFARMSVPHEPPAGGSLEIFRTMTTSRPDGTFTLPGLVPGHEYRLSFGQIERDQRFLTAVKPTQAETIDLGDLKVPPPAVRAKAPAAK